MKKCNNKSCPTIEDNIENNLPVINLDNFNKNKTYVIFTMPDCNSCHKVIKYFKNNNIKYYEYDLTTPMGLAESAYRDVIEQCKKGVPVILESISLMELN